MKDSRLLFHVQGRKFYLARHGGPEGPIIFGLSRRQTAAGVSALFIGRFEQM